MMGPREEVLALIDGAWATQAITAGCELGVFDALGKEPLDDVTLAHAIGADRDSVERLAKALCTLGLCERSDDRRFGLTARGQCLRTDAASSLHGWARMAGTRLWSNWSLLAQCVRAGQSARQMRGHDGFTELDADARAARIFNEAMVDLTRPIAAAAASAIDWTGTRTIVDVGGGTGALAIGILAAHPALQGIVSDLAHAKPSADAAIAAGGLASRCRFEAADFFAAVPAGGDAYLLKSVLHNWPDTRATAILHACRKSMAKGARIIVIERLEPLRPAMDDTSRDVARSDLNMLVGCGGRERTEAAFRSLLHGCGFAEVTVRPLAHRFHAIEAKAAA